MSKLTLTAEQIKALNNAANMIDTSYADDLRTALWDFDGDTGDLRDLAASIQAIADELAEAADAVENVVIDLMEEELDRQEAASAS